MNFKPLQSKSTLITVLVVMIAVSFAFSGCSKGDQTSSITASVAANATAPFQEIAKEFEKETGVKVSLNFGASGTLATQIINGAPVDFFASADVGFLDELASKGLLVAGTKHIYARGVLTIWTLKDSKLQVEGLQDLSNLSIKRIAMANPERAPYGAAAQQALQAVGLWDKLQPKLILGENVNQTMQYATSGNVDVAIVPLSLSLSETQNGQYIIVDRQLYGPLDQAMGVIKGSRHEKAALRFEDFVRGPKGQAIFKNFGYDIPEKSGE